MRSYYYSILASTPRCGIPLSGFDCHGNVRFAYRTGNPFSRAVIDSPLSQALSVTATSTGVSLLGPKARYRFAKKGFIRLPVDAIGMAWCVFIPFLFKRRRPATALQVLQHHGP